MYSINKNNVKELAEQIESLAKDIVNKVNQDTDVMVSANSLVNRTTTLVFTLGEFYAAENLKNQTSAVASVKVGNANYHNMRDSRGRFIKK